MIRLTQRLLAENYPGPPVDRLHLSFDERKRGRLSAVSEQGTAVGIFLERGRTLCDGDLLQAETGQVFAVLACPEPVVEARATDWSAFARVCYHLGNRHVPLQIGPLWLRFQPDHVLQALVHDFGLQTECLDLPFHPESGAYASHAHT